MKPHPVDVAKELASFSFFKVFDGQDLLQLAAMMDFVLIQNQDYILKEGELNTKLFFLRKGAAEILVGGEAVSTINQLGDVVGEMSVATQKPVSAGVRSKGNSEFFVLDSINFDYIEPTKRDHLLALFYRLYTVVLSERLTKTNEKARLFEIANRDIFQAQTELEKEGAKKVLLVESDKKQLLLDRLAIGGTGVNLEAYSSYSEAEASAKTKVFDTILVDDQNCELYQLAKNFQKNAKWVLLSQPGQLLNTKALDAEFDIFATKDLEDRSVTVRTVLTTLSKVLSGQYFGLEKYLTWGIDIQSRTITSSEERPQLKEEMCSYLKRLGVRSSILDRCSTVAEEMLMNAIYDAPVDGQGRSLFNHLPRQMKIKLEPHLQSKLQFATDGLFVGVSVTDPFGSLSRSVLLSYLKRCYLGEVADLVEGKGGAGRGLHQIVENSDITVINVKKGIRTEVIALFYVDTKRSEAYPAIHYFF